MIVIIKFWSILVLKVFSISAFLDTWFFERSIMLLMNFIICLYITIKFVGFILNNYLFSFVISCR